jgi:hypothetical protein
VHWAYWAYSCLVAAVGLAPAAARPLVFPEPQKIAVREGRFAVDEKVPVLLPEHATPADTALARQLVAELSDRYGVGLKIETCSTLPAGRFILMGTAANPLVRQYLAARHIDAPPSQAESYILRAGPDQILVAGHDDAGAFYGLQSLRQLAQKEGNQTAIRNVEIEDWPHVAFRGIRLYLPGHENIAFFRRFLRDFMALYKFNKVIMEVNASMRLDRHPELNAGWIDFAKDLYYTQRYSPLGANGTDQNSAHHDTADGEILEKDEVADLVRFANAQHIEVIPEIPTFTHSYYLLTRHKDLGAISGAEWPDIYDPTKPEVYKLVFEVLDEYIDVMKPKTVHIGHDEMFFPVELCIPCRSKDPSELWAGDVRKIHDYLAAKGIRTALYGDHLVESVRGVGRKAIKSKTGWEYNMPGALSPKQVMDLIPKDILISNWFWHDVRAAEGRGEPTDVKLSEFGFQQIHANFMYNIQNYARRTARAGVVGGAPSSWAATTEYTIGKDLMLDFLGTANLMWSTHWPEEQPLSKMVQSLMPEVRRHLSGKALPSENGDPLQPVGIASGGNGGAVPGLPAIDAGRVDEGSRHFNLQVPPVIVGVEGQSKTPLPLESKPIPIGADVSSIVFLHASAKPAANDMSYRYIHNFPDTADLLGWYEVVYDDGFVETVPVRYGWNILPITWGAESDVVAKGNAKELSYAYAADVISRGGATLFAYEWVNPRFGKAVKEVRLHGASGFRNSRDKVAPDNAIVLAAISVVKKRLPPPAGVSGR